MNNLSYRSAGRMAIVSGAIGILAFGFLIVGVVIRGDQVYYHSANLLFKTHDLAGIIQFVLMVPVAFALQKFSNYSLNKETLNLGIGTLLFTSLFLFLASINIFADTLYMLPQGVFGVWLIKVCWKLKDRISLGLRWFGIVVGLGLALVGTFPLGYIILVDTILLQIPAADPSSYSEHPTLINEVIHLILNIGSLMGVITLPIWTILLGCKFLRSESSINV